ncbi:E-selectin-like [Branchiostoma floridae x Branchiostoma japonicum]
MFGMGEGRVSISSDTYAVPNGPPGVAYVVQCPALTPPDNGSLSPTGVNSYNDEVMFTCNQGYQLEGASSVRCQANRTWSSSLPTCRVVQCPALTPPDNGSLSTTGVSYYNDEVMFTCNQGYELEGASSVRCQANQTWSSSVPTCTDTDECAAVNGRCDHICSNFPGGYRCFCHLGFVLMADAHGCGEQFIIIKELLAVGT